MAVAQIHSLAQEIPYAVGVATKIKKGGREGGSKTTSVPEDVGNWYPAHCWGDVKGTATVEDSMG